MSKLLHKGRVDPASTRDYGDLSEWDDEELLYGRRRDRFGRLVGKKPSMLHRSLHEEFLRRQIAEAQKIMGMALVPVTMRMTQVALGIVECDAQQMAAMKEVQARAMGKVQERIELSATLAPWQEVMGEALEADWDMGIIDVEEVT